MDSFHQWPKDCEALLDQKCGLAAPFTGKTVEVGGFF